MAYSSGVVRVNGAIERRYVLQSMAIALHDYCSGFGSNSDVEMLRRNTQCTWITSRC